MALELILLSAVVAALSGPVSSLMPGTERFRGQSYICVALLAAALGVSGISTAIFHPASAASLFLDLTETGNFMALDSLSILFLVPMLIIWGVGSLYSSWYLSGGDLSQSQLYWLRFFWGTVLAGMIVLVVARHTVLFFVGWELMVISSWFLIVPNHRNLLARRAAWIYFVASHLGLFFLFTTFLLFANIVGSLTWQPIPDAAAGPGTLSILFLLGLVGFGIKAGFMPFHVWLPGAHANAPSHVSAFMSGVIIKMGIYGILRLLTYFPAMESWWGALLIILGLTSAVVGIMAAAQQQDLKRSLAFSSVENIGIIAVGIGMCVLGVAVDMPVLALLGGVAALYHVIAHSVFKSLLFLSSGAVIHAAHARELNAMGGLGKSLVLTRAAFWVGALAAATLPLGSGFATEFLLILGFCYGVLSPLQLVEFMSVFGAITLVCCAAVAGLSFSRLLFTVFAGTSRGSDASGEAERDRALQVSLGVLSCLCLTQGVFPGLFLPIIPHVLGAGFPLLPEVASYAVVMSSFVTMSVVFLTIAVVAGFVLWRISSVKTRWPQVLTWDCGYIDPSSPRLQYSATSYSELLGAIYPKMAPRIIHRPKIVGVLPASTAFRSQLPERLLGDVLLPFLKRWEDRITPFKVVQQGKIQVYILYIYLWFLAGLVYSLIYSLLR